MNWLKFLNKTIEYSFYFLLFTIPLILTPVNYELFEFNKMMLAYTMTVIIIGAWIGKWIIGGKVEIKRTPLDIPILIFLLSQVLSTIFSIDRHTSIWGYYSRFHGGLLSTISYILLYYAFVSNMAKWQVAGGRWQIDNKKSKNKDRQSATSHKPQAIINCLYILLASATLVTFYGILEHFGIDADFWVQDVRNRVFSTLGQPNWLGAWIDALIFIPVAMALAISTKSQAPNYKQAPSTKHQIIKKSQRVWNLGFGIWDLFGTWDLGFGIYILYSIFYILYSCLLFTGSRSAFFGFLAAAAVFLSLLVISLRRGYPSRGVTPFIFSLSSLLFVIFSFLYEWKKIPSLKFTSLGLLATTLVFLQINLKKSLLRIINVLLAGVIVISLLIGTPITPPIGKLIKIKSNLPATSDQRPATNILPLTPIISRSSDIRKVVWKGAIDVWRHWPIFGSGVETFAYSYYNFRPREHNDLSEWDFLYNKAHNEYLNYLATTGIFGLGSYLLMIGWFLVWNLREIFNFQFSIFNQAPNSNKRKFENSDIENSLKTENWSLIISLLAGYSSILVTNFFGFSVVPVALLFWLFPAFVFSLANALPEQAVIFALRPQFKFDSRKGKKKPKKPFNSLAIQPSSSLQYFTLFILLAAGCWLLAALFRLWLADYKFAQGKKYTASGYLLPAYQSLTEAVNLNKGEPLFHSYLGETAAMVALAYHQQDASLSAQLVDQLSQQAIEQSEKTLKINSVHLNYYKNAAKTYIYLGQIEPSFTQKAIEILKTATSLSPTDAKLSINLVLLYQQEEQLDKAIEELEKTVALKPNYTRAHLMLAKLYHQTSQQQKAIDQLNFILTQIRPEHQEAKTLLEKWQNNLQ